MIFKKKGWENRRVFLEWANKHIIQINSDNHTKEDGSNEELLILKYNMNDQVQKNTKMCVGR